MRSLLALACLLFVLTGCATNRVDWNTRIGQYTYDEAIAEMGVPDRQATLSDGSVVAEWLMQRGGAYGYSHHWRGTPFQSYDINEFPDRYLRLTFGPDGQLTRAGRFAR